MILSAIPLAGGGDRATIGSCGAFSGGLMALSAKFSPRSKQLSDKEKAELEKARARFHEFRDWFIAEFSGVACKDVQRRQLGHAFNLMDAKEARAFDEFPGRAEKCAEVYSKAAVKVAEILSQGDIP